MKKIESDAGNILDKTKTKFPFLETNWNEYKHIFQEKQVPAKTILLRQGEVSNYIYLIDKGALRLGFNDKDKDVTFQFFFEGKGVASMESFQSKEPSMFFLESIEPSKLYIIHREDALALYLKHKEFQVFIIDFLLSRVANYTRLFLSRIKDSPEQRYIDLIKNEPGIVSRIPQHYIASYLGITAVSLSRIRNRVWSDTN
ncbi:Crp/Fnr family transcriptional regulator [Leptospira sp. 'Mane']|uniref:Crp/Fnr family transcriptional regulator n=1 Tax=Leptospira sp. 'Mane' TaxID=3387407 RepID=UPI00398B7F4B